MERQERERRLERHLAELQQSVAWMADVEARRAWVRAPADGETGLWLDETEWLVDEIRHLIASLDPPK